MANMACSVCGKNGHNAKSCPNKNINDHTFALWVKVDNLTEDQSNKLLSSIMNAKTKIAPNSRGTFAKAEKKDLPMEIKNVLRLEGNYGQEKK